MIKTGGGPPPKIKKDENLDLLMSIVNRKILVGHENRFDDDETPINIVNNENTMELIFTPEGETDQDIANSEGVTANNQNSSQIENTIINWATKLQEPVHEALQFPQSDKTQQKTPKSKNRRRPTTVVKTLTSSDVAKKYNLLLDKRLSLIDQQLAHSNEEHALKIKKLNLEVEILQFELHQKKANTL